MTETTREGNAPNQSLEDYPVSRRLDEGVYVEPHLKNAYIETKKTLSPLKGEGLPGGEIVDEIILRNYGGISAIVCQRELERLKARLEGHEIFQESSDDSLKYYSRRIKLVKVAVPQHELAAVLIGMRCANDAIVDRCAQMLEESETDSHGGLIDVPQFRPIGSPNGYPKD